MEPLNPEQGAALREFPSWLDLNLIFDGYFGGFRRGKGEAVIVVY